MSKNIVTDELIQNNPVQALELMLEMVRQREQENYEFLTGEPVVEIQSGQIQRGEDGKVIQQAKDWMRDYLSKNRPNGIFVHPQIGEIELTLKGVKDSLSHMSADIHLNALPAVPVVLENSVLLEKSLDKDGKDIENYIIAAPVLIDAEQHYVVVRIRKDLSIKNTKPKFYVVAAELVDDAQKNAVSTLETHSTQKDGYIVGGKNRLLNILHKALSVNTAKIIKGRSNNVKTAKGTKVATVFAVMEVDKVIASHTAAGAKNPDYPQELQPRDRGREASQAWVQKTSNDLDPESLGRSGRADTGAPIIGDDLVVESGNGRTMAIKLAYERGNADEYRAWLVEESDYFGFSPEEIEQYQEPILVRIRTSEVDRVQFTIEANQDDKLSYSATERAKADAKRLDDNMLGLFMPGDDGDLLAASNQKFIQAFLKTLGDTEAAQYITTNGKPTQALVTRIKAAVFSKAYNDDRLLEMMADQTKPDLQNMLNALGVAAPKFIEAQAVSRGNVQDISSQIVDGIEQALDKQVANAIIDATNVILTAKQNNQDIVEFVKQQGLFGDLPEGVPEIAVFLAKNSRSAKKMSLFFKAMAEFSEKQAVDNQNIGLFGEPEPVSIKDAIDYAAMVLEQNYGDDSTLGMFDSISDFLESDWFDRLVRMKERRQPNLTRAGADDFHENLKSALQQTEIDKAAHQAATSPYNDLPLPAEEQKQTGNYLKGYINILGLPIAIENPTDSIRSGTDNKGNSWQTKMSHHYGYIENTLGADGDEIDVFVKNGLENFKGDIYVINQINNDGTFDEHKVIIGAASIDEAKQIYLSNYDRDWQGLGSIEKYSIQDFKDKFLGLSLFDSANHDLPTDQEIQDDPLRALNKLLDIARQHEQQANLINEWDSQEATKTYQSYLADADKKYDGKLIAASKAYFNDHLNGKTINTKVGLVRINSKSRGKVHDRMRDVKYLAIPYIPEVLTTGDVSDLVALNKERDDSAVGYYEFKKSIKIDITTLNITLKVALDADGNLLYYLGASKEKANLRTISHARSTTGSKVGFDSIESQDDEEINIEVQVLDKDGNVLSDEEAEKVLLKALGVKIDNKPKKLRVYGWKAVEMAKNLTFEQLEILSEKVKKEHLIPKDERTGVYLFDKNGRKKLDALSWAVHHKLSDHKENPNSNDQPLDTGDIERIRSEFKRDYMFGLYDDIWGFDDATGFNFARLPTDEEINADPLAALYTLLGIVRAREAKQALITHTTKTGKQLDGVVLTGIGIQQAKNYDKYAFRKDSGVFIRLRDLYKVPDDLLTTTQIQLKQDNSDVSNTGGNIAATQPIRENGLSQTTDNNDTGTALGVVGDGRDEDRGGLRGYGGTGVSESVSASHGSNSDRATIDGQARTGAVDTTIDSRASGGDGSSRSSTQRGRDRKSVSRAGLSARGLSLKEQQQLEAEGTPSEWGNKENIDTALPFLLPEQRDDVVKAENRLIEQKENGILFTNGTGTGKTFTGLGGVKRFVNAGLKNILIVTLNDKIVNDFVKSANPLQLKPYKLKDTRDNGGDEHSIVVTTYANFGSNRSVFKKQWDLIVMDESHTLSQGSDGKVTAALRQLRALTGHHSAFDDYFEGTYSDQYLGRAERDENGELTKQALSIKDKWDELKQQQREKYNLSYRNKSGKRTKVIFLSATPFSYHFSLDWAEGYLFDFIPPEKRFDENGKETYADISQGYNSGSARSQFYMQRLGYRMRTNKLTRPDDKVDSGVLERNFAEELKKSGAMSGRDLVVDFDYDRRFILIESKVGRLIDEGLKYLSNTKDENSDATESFHRLTNKFDVLSTVIRGRFDYLAKRQLLEAIKAEAAIDQAKKHITLGRKVVIFHDYNEGGGFSPFKLTSFNHEKESILQSQYEQFKLERPDLVELDLNYPSPIEQIKLGIPNVLLFNGRISKGQREKNAEIFNTDKNGHNVIMLQSDAGSTGISLHDTTGTHQRVLINIGQPTKPAKLRQTEGRIYRTGQASNAIQRYLTTGTDWEREAFANTIAGRAETVDNFAKGNDAVVSIKESLIKAYEEAEYFEPSLNDGVGGKTYDQENARIATLSPFDQAMTYYYAKGKNNKRRDQREGRDWYATPEPLGYKMIEWAGVHTGDDVLEPSAGDGAIGRFVPKDASLTMIEPSRELASRAQMANTGAKILIEGFETHDIGNKYHAIVMNPPFGHGGSLAIEHIKQAFKHLYDGGRLVALIPTGAMNSKVETWLFKETHAHIYAELKLPAVTFENAGTAINTRILIIEKHENEEVKSSRNGQRIDLTHIDSIPELFEEIKHITQPARVKRLDEQLQQYGLYVRPERSKYVLNLDAQTDNELKFQIKEIIKNDFKWAVQENEFGELVFHYNPSKRIVKLFNSHDFTEATAA